MCCSEPKEGQVDLGKKDPEEAASQGNREPADAISAVTA